MMTNTGTEIDLTKILKLGESENHGTSSNKQQDLHAIIDGNRFYKNAQIRRRRVLS